MADFMDDIAMELIAAQGVGVKRNNNWLIRDVNIAVKRGEILTVIGPNGGGKTTLVRALLGLETIDEGRVAKADNLKIGYVPQKMALNWGMPLKVRHLLCLINNYSNNCSEDTIADTLAKVNMAGSEDKPVNQLSGGELQRVLLARTLFANPDLLVFDEPLQGVDFPGVAKIYKLIKQIRDLNNCGVLIISHDLNIVMAHTDMVICLNGTVRCRGLPQIIADMDEYKNLFGPGIGSELAIYRHNHGHHTHS